MQNKAISKITNMLGWFRSRLSLPPEGYKLSMIARQAAPQAAIRPDEVAKLIRNPHLAQHMHTRMVQIFPGPPEVTVYTSEGGLEKQPEPTFTEMFRKMALDVGLYESMQRTYMDTMYYGASVKSISYANAEPGIPALITEIRDLPADTFDAGFGVMQSAPQDMQAPNPLMPGLRIDKDEHIHVYQRNPFPTSQAQRPATELQNVTIITRPASPWPFGEALCTPIYSVLKSIDLCELALDKQVERMGFPLLFPKISDDYTGGELAQIVNYAEDMARNWGALNAYILPQGLGLADPMIHESNLVAERLKQLDEMLDAFFSPTSPLAAAGDPTLIGGSDAGKASVWRAFVQDEQAWVCAEYSAILQECLDRAGMDDYRVWIELQRPEEDVSAMVLQQLQLAQQAGVISDSELRERLDLLDLPAELPPDLIVKQEQQRQQQEAAFAGFGGGSANQGGGRFFGNVSADLRTHDHIHHAAASLAEDMYRIWAK